jgi:hypothetical protein
MSDLQQKADAVEKVRQSPVTTDVQKRLWKELDNEKAVSHSKLLKKKFSNNLCIHIH